MIGLEAFGTHQRKCSENMTIGLMSDYMRRIKMTTINLTDLEIGDIVLVGGGGGDGIGYPLNENLIHRLKLIRDAIENGFYDTALREVNRILEQDKSALETLGRLECTTF